MGASERVPSRLYADDARAFSGQTMPENSGGFVRTGIAGLEAATDFLTSAASILAASWWQAARRSELPQTSLHDRCVFSFAVGFLIVWLLERDSAYRRDGSLLRIRETERSLRVTAQAALFLLPPGLFIGRVPLCETFLLGLLLLPMLLMLQKMIFDRLLRRMRAREADVHRVAIYGAGDSGRRVVSALLQAQRLRLQPVVMIDDDSEPNRGFLVEMGYRRVRSVPVHSGPLNSDLLKACGCDLLIVVARTLTVRQIVAAEKAAERAGVKVASLYAPEFRAPLRFESSDLDGLSLVFREAPSARGFYSLAKRCFDLIGSSLMLVISAPLFALIALMILLDSRGPALFVQQRVGRSGELFSMFKFRSMYLDAPAYERSPVTSRDPRITRIGRLLRRTSLDELPQLLNVLRGDMSLVGPRPEMPFVVQSYSSEQRQRLQVMPGLTGLWQLSADRAFPIHEALEYDLYYIRNRGFFMDLAILIHTLFFAARGGI